MSDPEPRSGRESPHFLHSWLVWVSLGESVGFLAPALAQLATASLPAAALPSMVAAGAVEGAVLGWSQTRVLRSRIPAVSRSNWIGGTAAAAAFSWFLGLQASASADVWTAWPVPLIIVAAAATGSLLLCSIGLAQWLELRRHLPHSARWIAASAAAWCVGLAVFFLVAPPLWQRDSHRFSRC
ncbi:hypothetical protein [Cryobacterium sp. TmT2-59]|uniref:hypothetical protein n=1 Tax=Cryobacterium sp. TmT2-59 TaxID=1259264 RepID=UPI0015808A51|nr:hypothetical protein [Cryobacterium sp. TmT2-59]